MKLMLSEDSSTGCVTFGILLWLFFIIGWVQSIVKAVNSNWEPIGKREIVYTTGSVIPVIGGIVGWFNIQDK